jgi:anthranilate synthase
VVLSPGPGNPSDFGLSDSIALLIRHEIPGFGVCLGLQGMVEHFGGKLGVLSYPMHGKPSKITLTSAGQKEQRYAFFVCIIYHVKIMIGKRLLSMCC